ncbi:hypothetical protein BGX24_011477, partial [Mortierella sp. AD032]
MASASSPSFPPTSSLSSRRPFTPAPLSSALTNPSSTHPLSTSTIGNSAVATTTTADTTSRRHSQLLLDQALPTPRLPLSTNPSSTHRPISAYFADFSAECGAASPYTSEPVCVLPHLYLGAEHNATDVKVLSRLGITAVLNVAVEITQQEQQQQQQQLLQLPTRKPIGGGDRVVLDPHSGNSIHYKSLSWTHHQRNLRSEFPSAFDYIEEAKTRGGKVLVHCQLGVSRSASLVIAYVMKTLQMGLTDAYELVKARSAVISPNMSLMYQLSEFEKSLNNNKTVSKSPMYMDEDEEEYPYPTERMDIDGDDTPASSPIVAIMVAAATPKTPRTPKTLLPPVTTRPRSSHYLSSTPIPQTPMTDRFSFSSLGPSSVTPATAPLAPSSVSTIAPTTTTTTMGPVPRTRLQLQPTTPTTPRYSSQPLQPIQQYPEGLPIHNTRGPSMVYTPLSTLSNLTPVVPSTPIRLSPPMLAFATTTTPTTPTSTGFSARRQQRQAPAALSLSSSSSSVSSFATSSHSRPSSTSSASSASISGTLPDSPLQPTTPCSAAMKLTLAPTTTAFPVSSASLMPPPTPTTPSTPTTPTHKTKKTAVIQSLASVLTRRWSNHFQQSPTSASSSSLSSQQQESSNQIECISSMSHQSNTSSNGSMEGHEQSQARELGRMIILGQGAASAGVSVPPTPTTAAAAASA